MRVALVNLTNGGFSGGYLKYLRELVPRLARQAAVRELIMLSPEGSAAAQLHLCGLQLEWPVHDRWTGFRTVRALLRRTAPNVVFIPTARLVRSGIPTAVMVRNMEPLVAAYAGHSPRTAAANTARCFVARSACSRAARVIAVSEYVREYVVKRWHIAPERVGVVYHGVHDGTDATPIRPASLTAALPAPWLFAAGGIRPARGFGDLLAALAHLRVTGAAPRLVIAGGPDPDCRQYYQALKREAAERGVADLVTWAGKLTPAEVQWCLRNASMVVLTSRAEACPNFALEAMDAGALAVVADNQPFPEFFQRSPRYYSPGNARDLAAQISYLLGAPAAAREQLAARARVRARDFTWEATAERTAAELLRCIAAPRGKP